MIKIEQYQIIKKGSKCIALMFFVFIHIQSYAQNISCIVYDSIEQKPVADAFIFINDSSIGTNTDSSGAFILDMNGLANVSLIFSHLAYETYQVTIDKASEVSDTIYLTASSLDLDEVQVVEKSNKRIRARRMKKFVDAFLGPSTERKNVSIINPDVLLLFEEEGKLFATAKQALMIKNDHLGYTLQFFLREFELNKQNDVIYKGNISFSPMEAKKKKMAKYKRNRKQNYKETYQSFFKDLIHDEIKEEEFQFGYSQLNYNREFVQFKETGLDSIPTVKLDSNKYEIGIKDFLTVRYRKVKNIQQKQSEKMSATFTTGLKQIKAKKDESSTSYISSKTDKIIVDGNGRVLNPLDLEEYGFWASKRIASMLPFDYVPGK